MITCDKTEEGYTLKGLTVEDLDAIQHGLCNQFNQTSKKHHHDFRSLILRINRPIERVLDRIYNSF